MKYFIAGGCGFIGSELAHKLLKNKNNKVVVYDNLSSGRLDFLADIMDNPNLAVVIEEIGNRASLIEAMKDCDVVYHLASNADIAKAIEDPTIDFYNGTVLTNDILEAMRINGIRKILYASGSGVYGRTGFKRVTEDHAKNPVSTYGASKLAGEAMISAYCSIFDMTGMVFRFANVVGRNSTHGVIKDFIRKLRNNSEILDILGDGTQTKSYIHVYDAIRALTEMSDVVIPFDAFNISCDDEISVFEIAKMVVQSMKLDNVAYRFHPVFEDGRGWKGDVSVIKMDSTKARRYGWSPSYGSKKAIQQAINETLGIN